MFIFELVTLLRNQVYLIDIDIATNCTTEYVCVCVSAIIRACMRVCGSEIRKLHILFTG